MHVLGKGHDSETERKKVTLPKHIGKVFFRETTRCYFLFLLHGKTKKVASINTQSIFARKGRTKFQENTTTHVYISNINTPQRFHSPQEKEAKHKSKRETN